ncbi:MAG: hypothetical protein RRA15_13700 [bacterium]|nr:hypothetical protein [bacterium]MDT8367512.1 hypothetical protein [bacterium]
MHRLLCWIRASGRKASGEFVLRNRNSGDEGNPACPEPVEGPGDIMKDCYVYIVGKDDGMYVGMTSDLQNRLRQHSLPDLLFLENFENKERAVRREQQIKGWSVRKKLDLIKEYSQQ